MMTRTYLFNLGLTPLLNTYIRAHFRTRTKLCQDFAKQIAVQLTRKPVPLQKCIVIITRLNIKQPDWDGLYGGVKPVLDALVVPTQTNPHGIGLIEDDNQQVLRRLIVTSKYVPKRAMQGTTLEIYSMLDDYPTHLRPHEMDMYRRWSDAAKEDFHERVAILVHEAGFDEAAAEKYSFALVQAKQEV